ncbi:hypothetical protein Slin15195_G071610 [Septoria linicola]|uniref:Uncharacterized protein n=1 Tax=Septoria linicola TaxID=215465 RepID=A0A9Q9AQG3_9PEZI|nr:hypothetical protein Slin14017_G104360 [Septoria linicola]USW53842.1 hypothetical protein Slin15195_G071610 [Septoria linicola]
MVPHAASLLLALIGTTAAAENLKQPVHGPYRSNSGPHGRRADLNSPFYPIGTGSTTRTTTTVNATSQESTASVVTAHSRSATSPASNILQSVQEGTAVPFESRSNAVTPSGSFPALKSDLSTTLDHSGNTTATKRIQVPTALIVHETVVLQLSHSHSAQVTSLSHHSIHDSLNATQLRPVKSSFSISASNQSSNQSAESSGHVQTSLYSTGTRNSSGAGYVSTRVETPSLWLSKAKSSNSYNAATQNQTAGEGPSFNPPRPTICSGATLNIKSASLDFWYAETYTQVDSTFLIEFDANDTSTGWTLLSGTTDILNITSAIENPACSSTAVFNTQFSQSGLEYACSGTPTPAAKATSVVEQTAYTQPAATTSDGDIPDVVISPTPAALTVTNAGRESTYQAGTSVVHFSQFEIVDKSSYHHWNGSIGCIASTRVYDLPKQVSFEFEGEAAVNESLAVGKLGRMNFALMQALDQSEVDLPHSIELGDLEAEPTVVVVVEKVVVAAAALAQGILAPAPSLETPTATLPPGLSFERTTPTEPGTTWVPFTAHVESSADSLDVPSKTTKKSSLPQQTNEGSANAAAAGGSDSDTVDDGRGFPIFPFVAHIENSAVTLAIPANPTASVVTAAFAGRIVTATKVIEGSPVSGDADVGKVVSAIDSIAQPTNALEVLNNAQASFSAGAVASAIAAGIGFDHPANDGSLISESQVGSAPGRVVDANVELLIGNSIFTATRAGSDLVVEGQTIVAGGSPMTVAGQAVSLSPSATAVFFGGNLISVNDRPELGSSLTIDIGGSDVDAIRVAEGLEIAGQVLSPGGPAVLVNGRELSLTSEGTELVVGGFAVSLDTSGNIGAAANIPVIQVGTRRYTANAATQYNLDGVTLVPGEQVVVAGTTVSLGPSATRLLIDGKSQRIAPPVITPAPLLTLGNHVYKANLGSTYDIDSTLLTPGGQLTVSGTTVSLPAYGRSVVINGIARSLDSSGSSDADLATITAPPVLVLNGRAVSPDGGTSYVISGQTLTPGGTITFEGTSGPQTLSLNSAANMLITTVNGQSFTSRFGMVGAAPEGAPILTVDGNTYFAVEYNVGSGATYVIQGTTLTPGAVITIQGENGEKTLSLLPAGTAVVIESKGVTSRSEIEAAYGVRPTNAPILTIGGERFTAVNNDATYFVDGKTLSPGHIETVSIGSQTFIVSLSPHATLLEIVELGSDGKAIETEFETLFPATVAAATITITEKTTTTKSTSASNTGSTDAPSADDESDALLSFSTTLKALR